MERSGFVQQPYQPLKAPAEWEKEERLLVQKVNDAYEELYAMLNNQDTQEAFYKGLPLTHELANLYADPETGKPYMSDGVSNLAVTLEATPNQQTVGFPILVQGTASGGLTPYKYEAYVVAADGTTRLPGNGPLYTYVPTKAGTYRFTLTVIDNMLAAQTAECEATAIEKSGIQGSITVPHASGDSGEIPWTVPENFYFLIQVAGGTPPYNITVYTTRGLTQIGPSTQYRNVGSETMTYRPASGDQALGLWRAELYITDAVGTFAWAQSELVMIRYVLPSG